ncbi:hypothetical protein SO694_00028163 [Aureococcus anophagefferens]|uniref:Nucleotide-diphospho-sugar transferase domain-containing protein n=1 Tax=Aureococcus anophagefferens TaxID=44056 RepID=A0ABR1FVH6_AURAN
MYRDYLPGLIIGAFLAFFGRLRALHDHALANVEDHHDSSSRSAVAESLRLHAAQRVVATLDPDLPFFEACAPSQTCARNLHEPARDRLLADPRDGVADPLPESRPRAAYDRAAALDAVRSGACAPSAAVPRGLARPGTRDDAPCAYAWTAEGRPPAAPAPPPPAAGPFAERLRDTVGAALGAGASARVYWTVADASRARPSPTKIRPSASAAPATACVVACERGAAAAARAADALAAAAARLLRDVAVIAAAGDDWRPELNHSLPPRRRAADEDSLLRCLVAEGARDADARRRRGCGDGDLAAAAARGARRLAAARRRPASSTLETVVSHEHPAILSGSTVVHVRGGDDDLDAADDVKAGGRGGGSATTPYASIARVAKELQLWEGADDGFGDAYYAVGRHRRYVAVEDSLFATRPPARETGRPTSKARPVSARFGRWLPPDFHAGEKLALVAFNLALAAYFTGRVAVLPAGLHFEKFYYLWEFVDVEAFFEPLGVQFRESNFLNHPRLQVRGAASMGRVTVLGDGRVAAAAVEDVGRDYDARAALGARYYAATDLGRRLPYLVANEDPRVRDADVLYLDMDATMTNALVFPERLCFVKGPQSRSGHGCLRDGKVEDWLGLFYDLGAWCSFETKTLRGLNLITASDDCAAKRAEDARRGRLDRIAPVANRTRPGKFIARGGEAAIARKMQDQKYAALRAERGGLRAEPNEFG